MPEKEDKRGRKRWRRKSFCVSSLSFSAVSSCSWMESDPVYRASLERSGTEPRTQKSALTSHDTLWALNATDNTWCLTLEHHKGASEHQSNVIAIYNIKEMGNFFFKKINKHLINWPFISKLLTALIKQAARKTRLRRTLNAKKMAFVKEIAENSSFCLFEIGNKAVARERERGGGDGVRSGGPLVSIMVTGAITAHG